MKLIKNILCITILSAAFSNAAFANEKLSTEDFIKKIDSLMNKEKVLMVDSPEEYIYNLNTTEFVKGLLYETSIVLKFIAENYDNKDKLTAFNREFSLNKNCFSIIVGNADNHFDYIYNLTLKTDEMKDNYKKGYSFMVDTLEPYPMNPEYIQLCKDEKEKAKEYNKTINKKAN